MLPGRYNSDSYRKLSRVSPSDKLKEKLAQEKLYLEQEIRGEMDFSQIVGNSAALKQVLQLVETVSPNDSTVLLLGETGTDKELKRSTIPTICSHSTRSFAPRELSLLLDTFFVGGQSRSVGL